MSPFLITAEHFSKIAPRRGTRRKITIATLSFCALLIAFLVLRGDPENAIHTQALEYAFILSGTIATGYALSAVADNAVVFSKAQPEKEG